MPDSNNSPGAEWVKQLEQVRAARGIETPRPNDAPVQPYSADAPEQISQHTDDGLDAFLNTIPILGLYRKWIGKNVNENEMGHDEGGHVSCPLPGHRDNDPSAWLKQSAGLWYCPVCEVGGDRYDLAAIKHGSYGTHQSRERFPELRRWIAEDLGYTLKRTPAGTSYLEPILEHSGMGGAGTDLGARLGNDVQVQYSDPVRAGLGPDSEQQLRTSPLPDPTLQRTTPGTNPPTEIPPVPAQFVPGHPEGTTGTIPGSERSILPGDVVSPDNLGSSDVLPPSKQVTNYPTKTYFTLDLDAVLPDRNGFLYSYWQQCAVDTSPEEFHLWLGLIAVGLAVGRDVKLYDAEPVLANISVCLIGSTGTGKSRAMNHLRRVLYSALPLDRRDTFSTGTEMIDAPASAEALIWSFQREIVDADERHVGYHPVRGLVSYNELSGLMGRANRGGNVLLPTIMQFIDGDSTISTLSRGSGRTSAESAFANFVTTSQPDALKDQITDQNLKSGFLNRWLYITGRPKKRIAIGGRSVDLTECVDKLRQVRIWANVMSSKYPGGIIPWSDEANTMFTRFHDTVIVPTQESDDKGILTRADLYCKKLVLLFCADSGVNVAGVQQVQQMMHVWEYLQSNWELLAGKVKHVRVERNEIADRIIETILAGRFKRPLLGITIGELNKAMRSRHLDPDDLKRTLEGLVKTEQITSTEVQGTDPTTGLPKMGRPTTYLNVVDS